MLRVNGKFNINTDIQFGDKSIMHRALILASIADCPTTIHNAIINQDTQTTIDCLRKLGADITVNVNGNTVIVKAIKKLPQNIVTLDCKNSGSTARLLAGFVCGLNVSAVFVGDSSLSNRPMDRVIEPLRLMGANISKQAGCLFVVNKIDNNLQAIDYNCPVPSAQVKSAILIAGLFAEGSTTVRESKLTRNHTELLMQFAKCNIVINENAVTVRKSVPSINRVTLPNDISTAIYLIVASFYQGIILKNVGLNIGRTGALDVLKQMGVCFDIVNKRTLCGEPCGDIVVKKTMSVNAVTTDKEKSATIIDEVPILAMVACMASGTTTFCGVKELINKESNRIESTTQLVNALGGTAHFDGENFYINGRGSIDKGRTYFKSFNDHRIAMTAVVASVFCQSAIVDNEQCIDVSCPQFLSLLGVDKLHHFALIGSDIEQSLSPKLMCMLADNTDVNVSYTLKQLPSDCADNCLTDFIERFDGVNITMPFKQRVAVIYNATANSVNTVGHNIVAQSTDGYGFIKCLQANGINLYDKKILVVGAGGASRAIVGELLNCGAKVNIVNRTEQKAVELQQQFAINYKLKDFDGIVSTIPVCSFENSIELTDSVKFVFSAEYKQQSNLITRAKQKGLITVDGLQMLFWQGVKSFELWTGCTVNAEFYDFVDFLKDTDNLSK